MEKKRVHIAVKGIVQGVGFRPFIHKQITDHSLTGWIRNTSEGAELELEGTPERIGRFLEELRTKSPKLARIETVDYEYLEPLVRYEGFRIIESRKEDAPDTLISPDVCTCDDCLREMRDPKDRRYRYPFLNCTNCGPRLTIIRDIPYDRKFTSMAEFPMCGPCEREYRDIEDRRYHAQPTCCPDCGPKLLWYGADGTLLGGLPKADENEIPLRKAIEALKRDEIVCIKGLGGMHLACRIERPETVRELRKRKRRDEKPFALMVRDVEAARRIAEVTDCEAKILESYRRPIVLLRKKAAETLPPALRESLDAVSENGFVGVMLPYTPVQFLLFEELDVLVMTSANLSDIPITKDNDEALRDLAGVADGFLLNDRAIETRADDSLVWVFRGREYFARRSRGYVPHPVRFRVREPETGGTEAGGASGRLPNAPMILACGAEQKASFCLTKRTHAFPSQHIGDLKNAETLVHYETQIARFERLFGITPEILACDLHPDYLSTAYAEARAKREGLPLVRIQHHHAHLASCMEENGLTETVIGIVWDGTGLGADGTVWGSEFLVGNLREYARFDHLPGMKLPGGDLAVKEPWRIAAGILLEGRERFRDVFPDGLGSIFPNGLPDADDTPGIAELLGVPEEDVLAVSRQIRANVNCPVSTGMGRLFDAVSAMLGLCSFASYEGQGAVLLEAAISEKAGGKAAGRNTPETAASAKAFHDSLVFWAGETADRIRRKTGLGAVCLSGGTFQNQYLLEHVTEELEARAFRVYIHHQVSCNDEGISFGQAAVAREGGETYVPCGAFQTDEG